MPGPPGLQANTLFDKTSLSSGGGARGVLESTSYNTNTITSPLTKSSVLNTLSSSASLSGANQVEKRLSSSSTSSTASPIKDMVVGTSSSSPATPTKTSDDQYIVAVRIRPLPSYEAKDYTKRPCVTVEQGQVVMRSDEIKSPQVFRFDHTFNSSSSPQCTTQEDVFKAIGEKVLDNAWSGFNSSVFAYGQTGSGKTYTMLGGENREEEGLMPRICRRLLEMIEEKKAERRRKSTCSNSHSSDSVEDDDCGERCLMCKSPTSKDLKPTCIKTEEEEGQGDEEEEGKVDYQIKASYVEVYCEKVYDLMTREERALNVRLPKDSAPFVEGAVVKDITCWEDMKSMIDVGARARRTAQTNMNERSSRSHAMLIIDFSQSALKRSDLSGTPDRARSDPHQGVQRSSRIVMVDLAGSERQDKSGATGQQLTEMNKINTSLLTLGRCFKAVVALEKENSSPGLANNSGSKGKGLNAGNIPYRDSPLTKLLKESLGGNAKTYMLATISPSRSHYDETLSTLRYAGEAKKIVNHVHVNECPKDREIRQLRDALAIAEAQCAVYEKQLASPPPKPPAPTGVDRAVIMPPPPPFSSSLTTIGDLPYLTRLYADDVPLSTKKDAPLHHLSGPQTEFDEEGNMLDFLSCQQVAFTLIYTPEKQVFVTVPRGRRLLMNGMPCRFETSLKVEVWEGTRLATSPSNVFLVRYPAAGPADITGSNHNKAASEEAFKHQAVWDVLKAHPEYYWQAAQKEIHHGEQLTVQEAEALCISRPRDVVYEEENTRPLASPASSMNASTTSSVPEEESAGMEEEGEEDEPSTTITAEASIATYSTSASHNRMRSKFSLTQDFGPGRRAEPVQRLPRLAKANNRPLGTLGGGHALPAPVRGIFSSLSPPTLPSGSPTPSLDVHPTVSHISSRGAIRMGPSPSQMVEPLIGESAENTTQTHTMRAGGYEEETSYSSRGSLNVDDAKSFKQRFSRAESHFCGEANKTLNQEAEAERFARDIECYLPLVVEANTYAQAANKPISFYMDLVSRPATDLGGRLQHALVQKGHSSIAAGLDLRQEQTVLPTILESAELLPTLVVRVRGALNDSIHEMSIPEFETALSAMNAGRRRPGGARPGIEGGLFVEPSQESLSPYGSGPAAGNGTSFSRGGRQPHHLPSMDIDLQAGPDPFFFPGEDTTLGRSDVYLSPLLDLNNVVGEYPLLNSMDGSCIGSIRLRLVPEASSSPPEFKCAYTVALLLDTLIVDKSQLGALAHPSETWNTGNEAAAAAGLSPQVIRYAGDKVPKLVLRYAFWRGQGEEVELSHQASEIRELSNSRTSSSEQITFPIAKRVSLEVDCVSNTFLNYLATGSLRVSLHVTQDPMEKQLWSRYHEGPQYSTDRSSALSLVRPVDVDGILPLAAGGPGSVFGSGGSVVGGSVACRSVHGGNRRSRRYGSIELASEEGDDDTYSVMGSVAPAGAYASCSSLRLREMDRQSVRQTKSTRHASHFFANEHNDTALFLFMAVDVLEPVLVPNVDHMTVPHDDFLPVDLKPASNNSNRRRGLGSFPVPNAAAHQPLRHQQLPPSTTVHRDFDCHSVSEWGEDDSGDGGTGIPAESAPVYPGLEVSGAKTVYHVTSDLCIRMRRLKIVLEQLDPSGEVIIESCLQVRASRYMSVTAKDYVKDCLAHENEQCDFDLKILEVTRSACKRRMELSVEFPICPDLLPPSRKGERIVVMLEIAVFVEGMAQPVIINRDVVMKVLPLERKKTMMYSLRKSLKEPLSDRLHRVGSYYAVKVEQAPYLYETICDFVDYKLQAHAQLLIRMEKAKVLQEGRQPSGLPGDKGIKARPELTLHSWKDALNKNRDNSSSSNNNNKGEGGGSYNEQYGGLKKRTYRQQQPPVSPMRSEEGDYADLECDGLHSGNHESIGFCDSNRQAMELIHNSSKTAAAAALFGVQLSVSRRKMMQRGRNGAYRMMDDEDRQLITYTYPPRGMGDQALRERERNWDSLSRVASEEVTDYPAQREGFLNLRTGLLGSQSTRLWFVWRRPFLYCYKDKKGKAGPADVINVTDCKIVLGKDDLDFDIMGPSKTWSLQAAGEEDLTAWIKKLGQPVVPPKEEGGKRNSFALMPFLGGSGAAAAGGGGGGQRASRRYGF